MSEQEMSSSRLEWRLALVDIRNFYEAPSIKDDTLLGGFRVSADVVLNAEKKSLFVPVKIVAVDAEHEEATAGQDSDDVTDEHVLASLDVGVLFQFRDLAPVMDTEGNVKLSRVRVSSALGIAISTARGVLVGRAKHPMFSSLVLPVLSPSDFLNEIAPHKDWIEAE